MTNNRFSQSGDPLIVPEIGKPIPRSRLVWQRGFLSSVSVGGEFVLSSAFILRMNREFTIDWVQLSGLRFTGSNFYDLNAVQLTIGCPTPIGNIPDFTMTTGTADSPFSLSWNFQTGAPAFQLVGLKAPAGDYTVNLAGFMTAGFPVGERAGFAFTLGYSPLF